MSLAGNSLRAEKSHWQVQKVTLAGPKSHTRAKMSHWSVIMSFLAPCFVISRWTSSRAIQKFLLWPRQLRFWRVWQGVRQRPWPLILRATQSEDDFNPFGGSGSDSDDGECRHACARVNEREKNVLFCYGPQLYNWLDYMVSSYIAPVRCGYNLKSVIFKLIFKRCWRSSI